MQLKLWVIIVNYRTAEAVLTALPKLLRELEPYAARVVIVDNDSQDGSFEQLRDGVSAGGYGERVSVHASGRNGGFGFGNNVGVRLAAQSEAVPEYYLLMNPDAYPEPGCIRALVEFLDRTPRAGMAGAQLKDPSGEVSHSAFRFPTALGELESTIHLGVATRLLSRWVIAPPVPKSTVEVDWISGSCMLIRRAALEEVGLFDERFFLYYEEVDLCRRTREAGWSIYWVPEATIVHVGGLATGFNQTQKRRARYWFDSRRYYLLKARGRSYLWLANTAWLSGFAAWRVRRWLMQKPDADPPRLLTDFVRWTILSPNRLERAPRKLPTS